jgi:hypothetical protein
VVHHVIPKGAFSQYGQEARDALYRTQARLSRAGIGADDGSNGSFMLARDHRPLHTGDYLRAMDRRLKDAGDDPRAIREVLEDAARELEQTGKVHP